MFMSTSDSASDVSTNSLCDSSSCSFLSSPSSVSTSSSFSSTSSSTSECQVFLGGSCNPTTWRSDLAIPFLEEKGITYFNPVSCSPVIFLFLSFPLPLFFPRSWHCPLTSCCTCFPSLVFIMLTVFSLSLSLSLSSSSASIRVEFWSTTSREWSQKSTLS